MNIEEFRRKVKALSGERSMEILLFLKERGWSIAFDVAKSLHIHPTTAQRYLSMMHTAGIVSKRQRRCRTGTTHEYNLLSQKILISLNLSGEEAYRRNISPAITMISKIVDRLEKIGNPTTPEIFRSKREKELIGLILSGKMQEAEYSTKENSDALFMVLSALIKFSERSLGKVMTRDIVLSACEPMPESMLEFMPDYVQEVVT